MELTVTNRSQAYPKGTMVSEFGNGQKRECQDKDFVCGFEGADHTARVKNDFETDK